jgi:glutamine amidotransferase
MTAIVDYGAGNIASIRNMLRRLGHPAVITAEPEEVARAERLILPGVGAFDYGMSRLEETGLAQALGQRVQGEGRPLLGICLGAQLLSRRSEEGRRTGLGYIPAETVAFVRERLAPGLRVPHMGWAGVRAEGESRLLAGLPEEARFYFVHSYHLRMDGPVEARLTADHGYSFPAGVEQENLAAVQFHPEKSRRFGMQLLDNFVRRFAPRGGR